MSTARYTYRWNIRSEGTTERSHCVHLGQWEPMQSANQMSTGLADLLERWCKQGDQATSSSSNRPLRTVQTPNSCFVFTFNFRCIS